MVLNFDLNDPPAPAPAENLIPVGDPVDLNLTIGLPGDSRPLQTQTTPQLESIDDEVVICSPRSFAEAREKARRNRGVVEVIDAERNFRRGHSESTAVSFPNGNNRRKGGSTKRTGDLCWIDLERHVIAKNYYVAEPPKAPKPPKAPEPPKAPSFSCPVCMGPFVEETSTKCGHIFCKKCIGGAIAAQSKCPTCRRKLKMKDTIRIYLPTSD